MASFSIVIPQFNNAKMTESCIDSIINNTLLDHQIVIVDNGSVDQISDAHKKKVTYIRSDVNLLFAGGCNLGASHATEPFICFLNNDTLLHSGWDDCVDLLANNQDIGIVGPKLLYPDDTIQHAGVQVLGTSYDGNVFDHRYRRHPSGWPPANETRDYQCLTGACFFLRTEDFKAVGGFDTRYHNGYEDNDLCFKIRLDLNKRVVYLPTAVITHLESITSSKVAYSESPNKKLFFEKWADRLKEDKTYWDGKDAGNNIKIICIYKACEKELNSSNFKDERPVWFSKKKCFSSFYAAACKSPIKIDIHVVFDGDVNGDFATFIKSHDITFVPVNIKSMYKANQYCYQKAQSMDFDFCYFVEDDYLHTEDSICVLVDGFKSLGEDRIYTLYDHPDRYTRTDDLTRNVESIFHTDLSHWRTGESTTHTFAISKSLLKKHADIFDTEAFFTNDRDLYRCLYTKRNVRLVSPIPGKSTHVNKYFLTPKFDWEKLNSQQRGQ